VHAVYKASGFIAPPIFFLSVSQSLAGSLPVDRMSVCFSREHGDFDQVLVSLYGDVQKGGYIWVVTSSYYPSGDSEGAGGCKETRGLCSIDR
jgi:hypothetical protein